MNWKVLYTVKLYTAVIFLLTQKVTMLSDDVLFLSTLAADYPMYY